MSLKSGYSVFYLVASVVGGLALLFILAPLIGMLFQSDTSELLSAVKDKEVTDSIILTLTVSFVATIVFAISAIPLAYVLARKNFRFKRLVNGIIDLPVVIPHSAAGIAILGIIHRDTMLGKAASGLGFDFVGHPAGIAVAMAFVSIPFLINAARDGFSMVPERLEKAALNLGASPVKVFFTISLPLASRSIISGLVLMFARGMSEFGAVVIVAYHPMISPVMIFERFGSHGLAYSRPVAIIFIIVCLLVLTAMRYIGKERKSS
jgi:molybdate/tungstate transport system permease protein